MSTAADLLKTLQSLPPEVDPFDFVAAALTDQVYPDFGNTFWRQAYAAVVVLSVSFLAILASFIVRYRKGKLRWVIADGAASRPSPKAFVPLLWGLACPGLIGFSFFLEKRMKDHHLVPQVAQIWWCLMTPISISYAIISVSVFATAPPVRRFLMRSRARRHYCGCSNNSLLFLLVGLLGTMVIGSVLPGALLAGRGFKNAHTGFKEAMKILAAAKEAGNVTMLLGLLQPVALLEKARDQDLKSRVGNGLVYSAQTILYYLTGIIPAILLNRTIRQKINKLDQGLNSSAEMVPSALYQPSLPSYNIPLPQRSLDPLPPRSNRRSFKPELPKERPFADLVEMTAVPRHYQDILNLRQGSSQEKAVTLRNALKRDNLMHAVWFILLGAMMSLGFFQACNGSKNLSTRQTLALSYIWLYWSFSIPCLCLAGLCLYDAVSFPGSGSDSDSINELQLGGRVNEETPATAIQLSQTVEIMEDLELEDKAVKSEKLDYQ